MAILTSSYTGTDAGLKDAGKDALAANTILLIDSNITLTGTVPLGDIEIVLVGGLISGGGTLIFTGPVRGEARQAFGTNLTVKFTVARQPFVYPEWWGAVAIPKASLAKATSIDGTVVDSTSAWQKALACGIGDVGGPTNNQRYALTVKATGWYAITDELQVVDHYVNIEGKSPNYGGTGWRFVGTPATGWASKAILHFKGAQFSTVSKMGFMANLSPTVAKRLMAAVRTSFDSQGDTQRHITLVDYAIGDSFGVFWANEGSGAVGLRFENGVMAGGTGGTNGNDDFYNLKNGTISDCYYCVSPKLNMAVDWRIENLVVSNCMYGLDFPTGGSVIVDGYYCARTTYGAPFRFMTSPSQAMVIEVANFSCEHMQALSFIRSNCSVRGIIQGKYVSFTTAPPTATISQSGNTLTCTANGRWGGTEFFTEEMIGGKIIFDGATTFTDKTRSGTITAVGLDRTTATVSGASVAIAETANSVFVDADEYRSPDILNAYMTSGGANYNIALRGLSFELDPTFGTSNPGGYRMMITPGDPTTSSNSRVGLDTCRGAAELLVRGPNTNRLVEINLVNCFTGFGGGYGDENLYNVQGNQNIRLTGSFGAVGNNVPLSQFFTDVNSGINQLGIPKLRIGLQNGTLPLEVAAPAYLMTTLAAKKQIVANFLGANRRYLGVTVYTMESVMIEDGSIRSSLAVGTPASPFQFGVIQNVLSAAGVTNALRGTMLNTIAVTNLQITGLYAIPGSVSQAGTAITSSEANAFNSRYISVGGLNNATVYWVTEDGVVTATATLTSSARVSDTQVTATTSQTVGAGTAYLELPFTAGKKMIVQPTYFDIGTDVSSYDIARALRLPTLTVT